MKFFIQLAIGMLLYVSTAQAVSQVGGGKVQNAAEGFSFDIPSQFSLGVAVFKNDGIQLRAPQTITGIIFGHSINSDPINIYMLQTSFPSLTSSARQDVQAFFAQKGWAKIVSAEVCVEAAQVVHETSISTTLAWGNGNGVVIVVPNTSVGRTALTTMLNSLQLLPGACAWK